MDSQVRIRNKGHRLTCKLEGSPGGPYYDPENPHAQTPTASEGQSTETEVSRGGAGMDGQSCSRAKSEAQTMVESMATSVMQLTQAMHTHRLTRSRCSLRHSLRHSLL